MDRKGRVAAVAAVVLVLLAVLAIGFVSAGKTPRSASQCHDGIDNDGDGAIDYPADAGCSSRQDNDETNCGDGVCSGGESYGTCALDCAPVCGDNVAQGSETCDGSDLKGASCQSLGFDGGALGCDSACDGFDTSGCYQNSCTDSDGGFVYTVPGTISGSTSGTPFSYDDFCADTNVLIEYGCAGNDITLTNQSCTCSGGACV